jgi:hypothetical protein
LQPCHHSGCWARSNKNQHQNTGLFSNEKYHSKDSGVTALDILLSPTLLPLIQGKWERCDALSVNQEYAHCLHTNSAWLPIQSTSVYRETRYESNQAKCAKRRQMATAPVISSKLLSIVFFKANVVWY